MIEVTYNIIGNFMLCSCNRSNIGLVIFQVSILHYISEIISVKRFRTIDGNIIYMCSYPQGEGAKDSRIARSNLQYAKRVSSSL